MTTSPSRSTTATVRIGTRASRLARAQSQFVADRLAAGTGAAVELVDVTTHGDVDGSPLSAIGGQGVFVSAVRTALLSGQVDMCVHSHKDLPTAEAAGIELAAVPTREDPRDVEPETEGPELGRAATSTAGCAGSSTASSTRSCWPAPGWPGSACSAR